MEADTATAPALASASETHLGSACNISKSNVYQALHLSNGSNVIGIALKNSPQSTRELEHEMEAIEAEVMERLVPLRLGSTKREPHHPWVGFSLLQRQ
ncbi:hypothetical protein [Nesterenkonia sphaerica]|uniref:Uncharacterized protein n=1 Tax=Nesterenkonia sphaerica TaxID=1804988 RepID=A0A5R9AKW7_9MICC|nr:hypothetical protein [Nesterenkonia sphaerica]TLP79341.1 hypothetical protein FEF27_01685 [Nesterenkonia sphaerica]